VLFVYVCVKLCVTVNLSLSAALSLRAASSTSSADNVPIAWSCSLSRSFCSADTSARQADSFNQHKTTVSSAHHLPTDREIYLNIHNDNKAVLQSALQAPAPVIHMVHYWYRYTHIKKWAKIGTQFWGIEDRQQTDRHAHHNTPP